MHENSHCHHLQLPDGRKLSYCDLGHGKNGTWIHCHGIPGSRLELSHVAHELTQQGYRVIAPDRPGYGDSSEHPDYSFDQHTKDLHQLADHLGLTQFGLSGFSGGGVFAMATAWASGRRVNALAIAGTPAIPLMHNPFDHASTLTANSWHAALNHPVRLIEELQALTGSTSDLVEALLEAAGASDAYLFASEPKLRAFRLSTQTALAQGPAVAAAALVRDTRLVAMPWPFDPKELDLPMHVIHGQHDRLVHPEHFHTLAKTIGHARCTLDKTKGHYGVLYDNLKSNTLFAY
ncbi:alpha/beta fold hydrolase [Marinobacter nauticus]|uniref:AB hydrolase-1 domain-containing protein n=1 Tax=Marinobacter nauticus TaxID=2743 RepID=A0A1M2UVE9_MARNT|nr:alpha/beta hydrolase [Marinobacter nauticus]OJS99270.1 hypothetical protein BEE62_03675 [Marinobacter nauticus]